MTDRPIDLDKQIEQHLLIWKVDPYFKKLPKDLQNKVKDFIDYFEMVRNCDGNLPGFQVNKKQLPQRIQAKKFAMLFKKKYQQVTEIPYTQSFTGAAFVIFASTMKKIIQAGGTAEDYIDWFFNQFLQEKGNQKFMPPPINLCTNNNMVQKFLYAKKDFLKQRKLKQLANSKKKLVIQIGMKIYQLTQSNECNIVVRKIIANDISMRQATNTLKAIANANGLNNQLVALENVTSNK